MRRWRSPIWNCRGGSSRRITYEQGEWYCALSRQRELPDCSINSIEGRHADRQMLPDAILARYGKARCLIKSRTQSATDLS